MLKGCIKKSLLDDNCIINTIFENEDFKEFDISGIEFEKVQFQ